jgi:hypothetical protein
VLIVEAVMPEDDREHLSKLLDREMLVAANGRERTEAEYAELLCQAGFRFIRTVPQSGPPRLSKPWRPSCCSKTQIRRGSR